MGSYFEKVNYLMPTRIVADKNALDDIGEEVVGLGKKAFIVTGKNSARNQGYTQRVIDSLKKNNIDSVVYEKIEPNPDVVLINEGGEIARGENCDFVIGLGGGSAIDAAKGIAVVVSENKSIWDFVEGYEIKKDVLPIVAIPTTAGTGTETTPYSVISNKKIKRKDGFGSNFIFPKISILDPTLTISLSPYYTASTGIDTLAHAIEAYTSVFASPISDLFAIEAIKLVGKNLRTAVANGKNIAARTNMLFASTLAGVAIANPDTTIAHVIGEAVGAVYDTDHGVSIAIALPPVMEYNCVSNLNKYANITKLLEGDSFNLSLRDLAFKSADSVRDLIKDIKLPLRFSDIGVKDNKEILALALREGTRNSNPRSLSNKEFEKIINACI
ncbi:MAG TPA: iron-containing alcohol dehydrogenase [Candidatus Humimicrobiaceae bacterium]